MRSVLTIMLLAGCGGPSGASTAPSSVAEAAPPPAAPEATFAGPLELLERDEVAARLHEDGRLEVRGEHIGTLRPDGRYVGPDGSPRGTVSADGFLENAAGERHRFVTGAGEIDVDGRVLRLEDDGGISMAGERLPARVTGITADRRVTAAFLLTAWLTVELRRYLAQTAATEARANLGAIYAGLASSYAAESFDAASGGVVTRRMPAPAPRTPADVPCRQAVPWPPDAHPTWAAIGFEPEGRIRYSYEIEIESDDTFTARAIGDIDCDGELSTFTLRGGPDADGNLVRGEIEATDAEE